MENLHDPTFLLDRNETLFRSGTQGPQPAQSNPAGPRDRISRLLASLTSFFSSIDMMRSKSTWIFNHPRRIRRGPAGSVSLYLDDLSPLLDHALIWDDGQYTYSPPKGAPKPVNYEALLMLSRMAERWPSLKPVHRIRFAALRLLFRALIRIFRPKKILLLVWYGKEAIISAAKSEGVPVIELQHGMIYAEHPAYRVPPGIWESPAGHLLPDKCWVYGNFWKDELIRAGWAPNRIEVCGYFPRHRPLRPRPIEGPYILYTSQPGYQGRLVAHIQSIKAKAKTLGVNIIIALHPAPSEDPGLYSQVVGDNVRIIEGYDSYDLLAHCAAHISYFSTLLIESLIFGVVSHTIGNVRECPSHFSTLISLGLLETVELGELPGLSETPKKEAAIDHYFAKFKNLELKSK